MCNIIKTITVQYIQSSTIALTMPQVPAGYGPPRGLFLPLATPSKIGLATWVVTAECEAYSILKIKR